MGGTLYVQAHARHRPHHCSCPRSRRRGVRSSSKREKSRKGSEEDRRALHPAGFSPAGAAFTAHGATGARSVARAPAVSRADAGSCTCPDTGACSGGAHSCACSSSGPGARADPDTHRYQHRRDSAEVKEARDEASERVPDRSGGSATRPRLYFSFLLPQRQVAHVRAGDQEDHNDKESRNHGARGPGAGNAACCSRRCARGTTCCCPAGRTAQGGSRCGARSHARRGSGSGARASSSPGSHTGPGSCARSRPGASAGSDTDRYDHGSDTAEVRKVRG